ncbi:MaoC family dehydratase [Modestobacter muralis]|uniref:MaoC family dehydratase n=2 Tax=Modestobacter muralis TaxID=1608614 RepID=A0A6P0EXG7_9ACTN|nr:MaoC family dehydratase [Modestobacter muralis]NEK95259.1 MaoC family dehydratase [Modestobacter muralis]NEN52147.1 MaoC family dehydratase [Modestobacter muralis]
MDAIGTELGVTQWLTVDQDRIEAFAAATGDSQWIHVDPDRAAAGPFGTTIAHGHLTASLVPAFVAELLEVGGASAAINAGSDRVRFVAPVPAGSRLRASAAVVACEQVRAGMRATLRVTVEIEGGQRPALVADVLTVYVSA